MTIRTKMLDNKQVSVLAHNALTEALSLIQDKFGTDGMFCDMYFDLGRDEGFEKMLEILENYIAAEEQNHLVDQEETRIHPKVVRLGVLEATDARFSSYGWKRIWKPKSRVHVYRAEWSYDPAPYFIEERPVDRGYPIKPFWVSLGDPDGDHFSQSFQTLEQAEACLIHQMTPQPIGDAEARHFCTP